MSHLATSSCGFCDESFLAVLFVSTPVRLSSETHHEWRHRQLGVELKVAANATKHIDVRGRFLADRDIATI